MNRRDALKIVYWRPHRKYKPESQPADHADNADTHRQFSYFDLRQSASICGQTQGGWEVQFHVPTQRGRNRRALNFTDEKLLFQSYEEPTSEFSRRAWVFDRGLEIFGGVDISQLLEQTPRRAQGIQPDLRARQGVVAGPRDI